MRANLNFGYSKIGNTLGNTIKIIKIDRNVPKHLC